MNILKYFLALTLDIPVEALWRFKGIEHPDSVVETV